MADRILIDRAVVQQALSWILYTRRFLGIDEPQEERALRAALAQQAEPVQHDEGIPSLAQRLRAKGYEAEDAGVAVENIKDGGNG